MANDYIRSIGPALWALVIVVSLVGGTAAVSGFALWHFVFSHLVISWR